MVRWKPKGLCRGARCLAAFTAAILVVALGCHGSPRRSSPIVDAAVAPTILESASRTNTPTWVRRFGDAAEQLSSSIVLDALEMPVVCGRFSGVLDLGSDLVVESRQGSDGFVAKFDAAGKTSWVMVLGGPDDQLPIAAAAGAGAIAVVGRFRGTLTAGATVLRNAGTDDAFVATLDTKGNVLWPYHPNEPGSPLNGPARSRVIQPP